MSDEHIVELIESQAGAGILADISSAMVPLLDELLGGSGYEGCFGVDMMVYRGADGAMLICPTVELNLRMTMGVVAWHLCRHVVAPGRNATLRIRYAPSEPFTDSYMISGGRVTDGIVSLVPHHSGFRITLSVE